ncbi:general secretion pathway protein GspK [Omnitrophica bacterium]|nr:general secretion pathway protein GspK [Candidatus Omnitrophota bacterium]
MKRGWAHRFGQAGEFMNKGAILIVTTWILAILTLFAIGIGFRVGLEIKLTGYKLDRLKALHIAKAGIKKAIIEKWKEYAEGKSLGVDAFSESWSNNKDYFKNAKVGEGVFMLSYLPGELDRSDKKIVLYGLEDETSRININSSKSTPLLKNLLLESDIDLEEAERIVAAIEDWRDEDNVPKSAGGAEDSYYQTLDTPYATGGRDFIVPEELLLVRGITEELFYDKLKGYITVYGEGKININTASEDVLTALFGIGYPALASKIIDYRRGVDGKAGTDDDRWFIMGEFVIERGKRGMVEVKDLNDANWYDNIFGITDLEYKRIKDLAGAEGLLSTYSDYYRASCTAKAHKVKKAVTTVFKFNRPNVVREAGFTEEIPPPDLAYLYWHEER